MLTDDQIWAMNVEGTVDRLRTYAASIEEAFDLTRETFWNVKNGYYGLDYDTAELLSYIRRVRRESISLRGCFQSIEFVLTYMHDTKTIPQRPNRRTVGCSSSPTPSSQARGTTTYSGPAGGAQRHLVCASERMPMADAPARSAPLADSVQILPQVDDGWNVGKSP